MIQISATRQKAPLPNHGATGGAHNLKSNFGEVKGPKGELSTYLRRGRQTVADAYTSSLEPLRLMA
jgi:hypothetical protein